MEIDQGRNTKWYFGEGYVDQTPSGTPTTYYTIKDYLGNVRKVMKADGKSLSSLMYHLTPQSWNQSRDIRKSFGNTYQFYIWQTKVK